MIYTFHRIEGWYPLELPDKDDQIIDHVNKNPGTQKVLKWPAGEINGIRVWPPMEKSTASK